MTVMITMIEDYDEVIFKLFELFITSSSLPVKDDGRERENVRWVIAYEENCYEGNVWRFKYQIAALKN